MSNPPLPGGEGIEGRGLGLTETLEFLNRHTVPGISLSPKFLLMDEPLTSLDAARAEDILKVVERIRDELALPVLYVSHDMAEVERLTGSVIRLASPQPSS